MLNSPVLSLYHALQKIYSPLLLKDAKWSQDFDPRLQGLITELEKGLGSIIRRSAGESHSDSGSDFASILTPNDEAQYWADEANTGKRRQSDQIVTHFTIMGLHMTSRLEILKRIIDGTYLEVL